MEKKYYKKHIVTVRLNEIDYEILNDIQKFRNELQKDENIKYSYSDIFRVALHYMNEIEMCDLWEYKAPFN